MNLLEGRRLNLDNLGPRGTFSFSLLGLLCGLLLLLQHACHARLELGLQVIFLAMGLHDGLQVSGSFFELALGPVGMRSPIKCLFVGSVEMFNDEGTIKLYTGLLVEHVEACGAIGVDLTDLGLDIALVGRSARIFEELDGLAEVLDSFFEGLLAELIVTLFLQCTQLRLQRVVVSRIDSSGLFWCRCSGLCWKLLDLGRRWLLFNRCGLDHFFNFYFLNSSCLFHLLDNRDRGRCLRSWSLTLELGEIWE